MRKIIIEWVQSFYTSEAGVLDSDMYEAHAIYWTIGLALAWILASYLVWLISKIIMNQVVHSFALRSKATWDDHLLHNKVFRSIALLVPLTFMEYFMSIVFFNYPNVLLYSYKIVQVLIILACMIIVSRFFNALRDIFLDVKSLKDKPIESFTQIMKIIVVGILIIVMLSTITEKSLVFFLTSLGAVSAILLLIFKDTILGFVGSIQLSTNDMIRIGDWVTMEKFGADGDVEEINITTVKVRNFDKTITTIPTYSFISDSFRNWRGMQESEGRRIKRSVLLHIDSIHFATPALTERLGKMNILTDFIEERQKEIEAYNREKGYTGENAINARRQTKVGLFRRYLEYYLDRNENINSDMTIIVRQLNPTEYGLPIEIYCFSKTKDWKEYEGVVGDIFDHIIAMLSTFELRAFERPTGFDLKAR